MEGRASADTEIWSDEVRFSVFWIAAQQPDLETAGFRGISSGALWHL